MNNPQTTPLVQSK